MELAIERDAASLWGVLGDQLVNICTMLSLYKAKYLQRLLTTGLFPVNQPPCWVNSIFSKSTRSRIILWSQTHHLSQVPMQVCSPVGQWVVGDSGKSCSWMSPGADTAMQLQCRAPGTVTLIQWHCRCPLNKGHVAGAGSACVCAYLERKAGPGFWVTVSCCALC